MHKAVRWERQDDNEGYLLRQDLESVGRGKLQSLWLCCLDPAGLTREPFFLCKEAF